MITIFTTSPEEFEMALKLSDYLSKNLSNPDVSVTVNPPRDSFAVTAWSVDDIVEALEKAGVNSVNLSDELLMSCIDELDIPNDLLNCTVPTGVDMLEDNIGSFIDLLNEKTKRCNHRWPVDEEEESGDEKVCTACGIKSTPEDYQCGSCDEFFSLFDLDAHGCCPHCGSSNYVKGCIDEGNDAADTTGINNNNKTEFVA